MKKISLFLLLAATVFSTPKKPVPPIERVQCDQKFSIAGADFPFGGDVTFAYDYFRSLPDGSWNGNTGLYLSANLAIPFYVLGMGAQVGGSYGVYDWYGKPSLTSTSAPQQQAFVSGGLFRMTQDCSGFNIGVIYDGNFNKQFGIFGLDPYLSQLRAQLGWLFSGANEVGVWGTGFLNTAHQTTNQIPVQFRAISQVNLFWTHHFKNLAQTTFWAGAPYLRGIMYSSGTAGTFILGARIRAPLSRNFSFDGHGSYMGARQTAGTTASKNYAANATIGITYSFGGPTEGKRPYLPPADNSTFLTDTNLNN